jgi:death-on-curing family protein
LPKKKTNRDYLCVLGARYIEYIHDELLDLFWPSSEKVTGEGLRDKALLESALARPFQSAFGSDIHPTILEKAVALFHSLIANHAFVDGNKRTAVTAFDHFLLANGFVLGVPNSEMYGLATRTASYRERHLSHDDALRTVISATRDLIVPIASFKSDLSGIRSLEGSFQAKMKLKSFIRKQRDNRLVPAG